MQRLRRRTDSWCGARSADGTLGAARAKAIPVQPIGIEALDLDVHRVRELGKRARFTGAHDVLHPVVARNAPLDLHRRISHSPAAEWLECEAGPENDAVGSGITGRDAERERVLVEPGLLEQRTGAKLRDRRECGDAAKECSSRRQPS